MKEEPRDRDSEADGTGSSTVKVFFRSEGFWNYSVTVDEVQPCYRVERLSQTNPTDGINEGGFTAGLMG